MGKSLYDPSIKDIDLVEIEKGAVKKVPQKNEI